MNECTFTPQNKDIMAKSLLEAFVNRLILLYDDSQLTRDLMRLRIKEGPVGLRLDATKDDSGHCDKATALCIALPSTLCVAREGPPQQYQQDEVLIA